MSPYVQKAAARAALPIHVFSSRNSMGDFWTIYAGTYGQDDHGYTWTYNAAEATRVYLDLVRQLEETT